MKINLIIIMIVISLFSSCKQIKEENKTIVQNGSKKVFENKQKYSDIKEVDFKNFVYENIENKEDIRDIRCLLGDFPVKNGSFKENPSNKFDWTSEIYFDIDEIIYGDLTGDGKDEAIIKSSCVFSANPSKTEAYIYKLQNETPQYVALISGGSKLDGAIINLKILPNGVLEIESIGSPSSNIEDMKKYIDKYILKDKNLVRIEKTKVENYKSN